MKIKNFFIYSYYKYIKKDVTQYVRSLGVTVGENCELYKNVIWGSEPYLIQLGNNVRITNGVSFVTHDGGLWTLRKMGKVSNDSDIFGKITVGDNTHIGWNTIIMPNVNIGKNCIIGCGAVVTKDIPDNSIAVGVPARVIKNVDMYMEKNQYNIVLTKGMTQLQKKEWLMQNRPEMFI